MAYSKVSKSMISAALYCRLSKEDENCESESASIATQKSILTEYCRQNGWHIYDIYVDDGYSGTNFNRPSFQRMIKDIEDKKVNLVITKDLSRLGRSYLDCGLYLEVFFPEHGVRYVSVNDGTDTANQKAMDITPFRNILNEMYAADISMKVKSAYNVRQKQGLFMATTPPYGYLKDPNDHNHLIIDPKVAPVVKKMFDLAMEGYGIGRIRRYLIEQHILRPAAYAGERGEKGYIDRYDEDDESRYQWSENGVRGILRSAVYAGDLVYNKRPKLNMKSKKRPSKLPEDWSVVPNTHEGIVSHEVFDTVQRMMTSRRRTESDGSFDNIFAGIVKCGDCGYAMRANSAHRRKREDILDCIVYSCNNYGRYGNEYCTAHSIEARDLYDAVLSEINHLVKVCKNEPEAQKYLYRKCYKSKKEASKDLEIEAKRIKKRLSEIDNLFMKLFEERVDGGISERNYRLMSVKYTSEQNSLQIRIDEIGEALSADKDIELSITEFMEAINKLKGIKTLTAAIVNSIIDKILVYEKQKDESGEVTQKIVIVYKYLGEFSEDIHIVPTPRKWVYPNAICSMCGKEFEVKGARAMYCPECRIESHKIQAKRANERRTERRREYKQAHGLTGYREKICAECGKTFKPKSGHAKYCSSCMGLLQIRK